MKTTRFRPAKHSDMVVDVQMHLGTNLISNGPLVIAFTTICCGCDRAEFADSLRTLHHESNCSAHFTNTFEDLEVILTLDYKGRGDISVVVNYPHPGYGITPNAEIRAGSFRVNQSMLPKIISDIQRYLTVSGTSTKHLALNT